MDNLKIYTIIDDALYAFQWEGEDTHCLDILTRELTNIDFLRPFFLKRKEQLSFFANRQPIDAAVKTLKEVRWMEADLLEIAKEGMKKGGANLSSLFSPLDDRVKSRNFIQAKAKGDRTDAPWVRIYAIKVDENEFYITGGGIKLTKTMEEDEYLKLQLERLKQAEAYLTEIGFI